MKSKLTPNNCITCGVDLNHCADKNSKNNQCGYCSPSEPLKDIEIDGKKYKVKTTLPLILLLTSIGTLIISFAIWQTGTNNLSVWIMIVAIIQFVVWSKLFGMFMFTLITKEIKESQS